MIEFTDENGNKVMLSFSEETFENLAKHVLVICQYGDGWLLTKHKHRGLEFPGGKVEQGETLEEAARREVFEETGAILGELQNIGKYKVEDLTGSFVKAIFWGQVEKVEQSGIYFETNGPAIVRGDLGRLRFGEEYSFIMKDRVVEECLKVIELKQKE